MAVARQMPSGNWRIQPYKVIDGKVIRTSITAPTKKEAERLASIWDAEQEIKRTKGMTVRDAMETYIATCKAQGYSPSTVKEYTARMGCSYNGIIDLPLSAVTTSMVQKHLDARAETVKPKTVKNDLSFLKAALNPYSHRIEFDKLKTAKKKKRKKLEMKDEWKTQIPVTLASKFGKDDYYFYCLFLIYAGLRPSETYALTWGDISKAPVVIDDEELGVISVSKAIVSGDDKLFYEKETKTEAGNRNVIVSWELIRELTSVKTRGSDEQQVMSLNPYNQNQRWVWLRGELGIPKQMRRYDLRHYFATTIVLSGATEEELQLQMGHSTSGFTHSVYVEIMQGHKDAVVAKFAAESKKNLAQINGEIKD